MSDPPDPRKFALRPAQQAILKQLKKAQARVAALPHWKKVMLQRAHETEVALGLVPPNALARKSSDMIQVGPLSALFLGDPENGILVEIRDETQADSIRVSFDLKRRGWVIQQEDCQGIQEGKAVGPYWREVAFVDAFASRRPGIGMINPRGVTKTPLAIPEDVNRLRVPSSDLTPAEIVFAQAYPSRSGWLVAEDSTATVWADWLGRVRLPKG